MKISSQHIHVRDKKLESWEKVHLPPYVTFILFSFHLVFGQSGESSWWRVCYQRGLPRLVYLQIGKHVYTKDFNNAFHQIKKKCTLLVTVYIQAGLPCTGVFLLPPQPDYYFNWGRYFILKVFRQCGDWNSFSFIHLSIRASPPGWGNNVYWRHFSSPTNS